MIFFIVPLVIVFHFSSSRALQLKHSTTWREKNVCLKQTRAQSEHVAVSSVIDLL